MFELGSGHREVLDGRLCRPDSEGRPLISKFTTMAIVKLCCHNFTQSAYFMIFCVSSISYRPTYLSLLKEFSKNVSFWKFYIFHQIFPRIFLSFNFCFKKQLNIFGKFFTTRHKQNHEICTLCEVVAAQFYYSHSSKIANQWPPLGKIQWKM